MLIPLVAKAALAVALLFGGQPEVQYDSFASNYDSLNKSPLSNKLGIDSLREEAGRYAKGSLLEVAVGTGIQTAYYDWSMLDSYTGVDTSREMLRLAEDRFQSDKHTLAPAVPVKFEYMDASSLTYGDKQVSSYICVCLSMYVQLIAHDDTYV